MNKPTTNGLRPRWMPDWVEHLMMAGGVAALVVYILAALGAMPLG